MTPSDIIAAYYAACETGDAGRIGQFMLPDCVVHEPSFLPYGRVPVIGIEQMLERVGSTFFRVFEHVGLRDTRYFELGEAVVAVSIWDMIGRHDRKPISCHYHEYFEIKDGRIALMRPFYHAINEMIAAFEAAREAGEPIDIDQA